MARDRASRPEAKPLRLFVAVDVPQDVRESIAEAFEPLRERYPRARWVPLGNQHVTVKFLGTTWPRLVERVVRSVEEVAAGIPPFATRARGAGAFPTPRRARVLWAGLEDPDLRWRGIAEGLDEALAPDFRPEARGFTPHLTIARFSEPERLEEDLAELGVDGRAFDVSSLVVYRSHLRRPAPVYESLASCPLGGRPGGRSPTGGR